MAQQREVLSIEAETARKIAARAFAQNYLSDLVPSVFGALSENGYFYDPVAKDVEGNFVPWLLSRVKENMGHVLLSRVMVDELIRSVCDKRLGFYHIRILSSDSVLFILSSFLNCSD